MADYRASLHGLQLLSGAYVQYRPSFGANARLDCTPLASAIFERR